MNSFRFSNLFVVLVISLTLSLLTTAANADIEVYESGTLIADNTGSFNFTPTPTTIGIPVTKTFTISNTASIGNVFILGLSSLPAGFSSINFPAMGTPISGGSTKTFQIQLDASSTDSPSGTLSFGNSGTPNPYNFTITGTVDSATAPEIDVLNPDTGLSIVDGGSYDFDTTNIGTPVTKTFTVRNSGDASLNLIEPISLPTGFSLTSSFDSTTLASSGGSTTFEIQLDASSAGTPSGELSFGNDDGDKNPYNFTISATVTAPEIDVLNPDTGTSLSDGSGFIFGGTTVGNPVSKTFTVKNTGDGELTLSGLSVPTGFNIVSNFGSTTVAPSGSTTFTVQLDASSEAILTGSLSFTNNDSNENPYNFTIAGSVSAVPEIDVLNPDSVSIPDDTGSYDFGTTTVGNPVTKTFTVKNTGSGNLTLIPTINLPSGFSVVNTFASTTVAPSGGSTTFEIKLDADNSGNPSGELSFNNDDGDEAPYNFIISGTVGETNVWITDATANESDGSMSFTIRRDNTSGPASGSYTTADNTAYSGSDYSGGGTWNFSADGFPTAIITINLVDDTLDEDNESFFVNISSSNANITDSQAIGTIIDNDTAALSINDIAVTEGNSGTANATFTVSLSPPSAKTVTVNYSTATAGTDYEATSGSLEFTTGQTSKTFTVPVIGDIMDEDDETFVVNLSGPSGGAIIEDGQGICTITDNDSPPSLSIDDVTVTEGNSGTVNAAFTVTLSTASSKSITVDYETADNTAISGTDYTTAGPGTLTFSPGETAKTVNVAVNSDIMDEDNENFYVNLSNPGNAAIADGQGMGTITTDDAPPALSIDDVSVIEGNDGTVSATFTISLSTASSRTVTVNYQTADVTAIGGTDYDVITTSPLTFDPGDIIKTVEILVSGDTADEHDETFYVNLTDAANATLGDFQGIGTITNDDSDPEISIDDVTVTEGNTGTVNAIFTVSLSSPSSKMVSVDYQTADSTAVGETDYTPLEPASLTFNPGDTLRTVHVVVNSDTLGESDEIFHVNLSNPANAVIARGQGIGKITDDDIADHTLSVNNVTVFHDDTSLTFTVTLSAVNESDVSVAYATNNGTAKAGKDYTAASGTLTISAGSSSATVTVALIANDARSVNGVFFTLDLNDPDNATLRDNQGVGRITGKIEPGDVNGDGNVDIEDAILTLQILAGIESERAYPDADVDGDGKIGVAELIFILQTVGNII